MKKRGDKDTGGGGLCLECDPSPEKQRALGSALGAWRHRHYLTFTTDEALENHLRACTRKRGEGGYGQDDWIEAVVTWWRVKRRLDAQEASLREQFDRKWGGTPLAAENGFQRPPGSNALPLFSAGDVIDAEFSEHTREPGSDDD